MKEKIASLKFSDQQQKKLKFISRLMDSFAILLGVSALSFLIIRINLTITEIKPLLLGLIFLGAVLLLSLKFLRRNLYVLGLIASFFGIIHAFDFLPSIQEPPQSGLELFWKWIFLPLTWIILIIAYALRSYFGQYKFWLSALGFVFGLILLISGCKWFLSEIKYNPTIPIKPNIVIKAGDPLADLRLNPSVRPDALKREEARLGLDKPLWRQYVLWLDGIVVKGDLGLTQQGEPVIEAVKKPLRNTIILNICVLFFTWLIGVPLGVFAAQNKGNFFDKLTLTLSSLSITTPAFLLTIFILGFAIKLGIGEIGGLTSVNFHNLNFVQKIIDIASHLLLPVSILTFVNIGSLIRQMRGNLLDVLNDDYIKAARARGVPERIIFWQHAFQNAINPLITLLGFEFTALVSGAALTEMILAYPGIGALTLEAAKRLDINLIMFNLLLGTIMLMLGNALADWLLRKVDPRIQ